MSAFSERIKDLIKNEYLIPAYAKRKCKMCIGKGIIERHLNTNGLGFVGHREVCECVKKELRKELNESESTSCAEVGPDMAASGEGCSAEES